jgi:hypothetical protein
MVSQVLELLYSMMENCKFFSNAFVLVATVRSQTHIISFFVVCMHKDSVCAMYPVSALRLLFARYRSVRPFVWPVSPSQ